MAKILMAVWPIETHLNPFVATARALRSRGHSVGFYCGGPALSQLERMGFRCFPFREVDIRSAERNPGAMGAEKMGMRARRKVWQEFLLGSVPAQVRDLERIWPQWQPDTVVCDITMWGPMLVTHEVKQVPVVALSHTAYCLLPGNRNPAPGISLPRPRNLGMRVLARLLSETVNIATASIPREANRIRAEYGLPPLHHTVMEFMGSMPLNLIPSAPAFDYERDDLPASVQYVGPCFWEEEEQCHPPEWVTQMRGKRPRIVVLEETHYAQDPFLLRTAAAALAGHQSEVILVAGRDRDPLTLDLGQLSANVRLEPWAPLRHTVFSADVVLAHGNSDTVLSSLSRGIPMVVVPRILEQPQIAWRLSDAGAGIRLPMSTCTPGKLRKAVDRVLSSPQFGRNARRLGAALGRMGGPARAAELIEGLDRTSHLPQASNYA